jgi:hypothetical protein
MLNDYGLSTFLDFQIKNSVKITTNMHTKDKNIHKRTKQIEIELKVKPTFFVIDDD